MGGTVFALGLRGAAAGKGSQGAVYQALLALLVELLPLDHVLGEGADLRCPDPSHQPTLLISSIVVCASGPRSSWFSRARSPAASLAPACRASISAIPSAAARRRTGS